MGACPSCGAELPPGARFCAFCGTRLADLPASSQERRTVTIVFVDLVGFTERSDHADPEDVRRTLVPFHRRVKEDLERSGGTLDKFIGDAVMGVFGAPVAHEDDPQRAVHAAMRILDSIADLRRDDPELAVRIAVNTGEAVVSFGVGPQVGEAVAGDVVNTASRMQSLAPRDSIVIGEATMRAVRDRYELEAMPAAPVKGKSEPLRVWRILSRREQVEAEPLPFVGRRREISALIERFEEVDRSGSSRVVTVVADAGFGKSRLVAELTSRLGERAGALTGRCPPYGEGVTFAPVEQTVRALVGIEPEHGPATAVGMLERFAERLETDQRERRWLVETLDAVLSLEVSSAGTAIGTSEIAQAWARVLEAAIADRPLLLVIEDLHHAAPALAEVLAGAAELLSARPMLLLATARSQAEVPERWAVLPGASALALSALSEAETRELLGAAIRDGALPESASAAVLERSAGNPLYAIELARMVAESGVTAADAATPASVQAVIAARLDTIPAGVRALAQGAAVLGEEVWPEALASLHGVPVERVRDGLEELERRGLLVRRASSFPGSQAYGFVHALIREVAYGRLPRAARARRHLAAATWLEDASGDRAEEWAESLAHHFASAAEIGLAANEAEIVERASGPAVRWLLASGDRAARVDPAAAFATFERALALAGPGTAGRGEALWRSANAGRRAGSLDAQEVLDRHEEALGIARALGDEGAAGESLVRIGTQLAVMGETGLASRSLAEAIEILERHPPGRALARAYAYRAEEGLFAGDTAGAIAFADRALGLLEDERDEVAVMALHLRGDARCSMGDLEGGLADLADALRRAEDAGRVGDVVTSRNYLAEWRWAVEGPAAGLAEWESALALAERRNQHSQATYAKGGTLAALLDVGEWDRVLERSAELLALPPRRLDPAVSVTAILTRARVLLARGRRSEVIEPDELVRAAERLQEIHALAPALVTAAEISLTDGDAERASARLIAFGSVTEGVASEARGLELSRAVRLCLAVGRPDVAERLVAGAEPGAPRDRLRLDAARAALAEARGEQDAAAAYLRVAERLRAFGEPFEEAMALLGHARLTGSEVSRERARALLERLGIR
jgi:class 3 adenylate cyclase/tetratricopeptide (TPR) repeat protein